MEILIEFVMCCISIYIGKGNILSNWIFSTVNLEAYFRHWQRFIMQLSWEYSYRLKVVRSIVDILRGPNYAIELNMPIVSVSGSNQIVNSIYSYLIEISSLPWSKFPKIIFAYLNFVLCVYIDFVRFAYLIYVYLHFLAVMNRFSRKYFLSKCTI